MALVPIEAALHAPGQQTLWLLLVAWPVFSQNFQTWYCPITMLRIHSNSRQKPSGQKPSGHAVVQHRLLRLLFLSSWLRTICSCCCQASSSAPPACTSGAHSRRTASASGSGRAVSCDDGRCVPNHWIRGAPNGVLSAKQRSQTPFSFILCALPTESRTAQSFQACATSIESHAHSNLSELSSFLPLQKSESRFE